jgi:hypothetical protein
MGQAGQGRQVTHIEDAHIVEGRHNIPCPKPGLGSRLVRSNIDCPDAVIE